MPDLNDLIDLNNENNRNNAIVSAPFTNSSVIEGELLHAAKVRHRDNLRLKRWLITLFQIIVGIVIASFFYLIPVDSLPTPFQSWKNPLVVFMVVIFIGKTLYDTLFYDHYQP
jgi:sterol desaturase/sphingolipid hydroxylase (fatty acid hydroxylase superfamily)